MKFLLLALLVSAVSSSLITSVSHVKGTRADGPIMFRYEVTNNGDSDETMLIWGTPFFQYRGVMVDDPLQVTYTGNNVQRDMTFLGIAMKHAPPTDEDYITIPAGGSKAIDVDVAHSYDMGTTGTYSVGSRNADVRGAGATITVEDGVADLPPELNVADWTRDMRTWNETAAKNCGVFQNFINCNNGDLASMRTAILQATQAVPALPVFTNDNPGDANSARWFGLGGTGLGTVRGGYQRSQDLMCAQGAFTRGTQAQCDYGCSAYAYVYPTDPTFTIYLCSVFFQAPATGRDSKFGTVLHEAAHFNPTAGTRDVQYGCSGCQALAISNPNGARQNSDSFEFNAEFSGFFTPVPGC